LFLYWFYVYACLWSLKYRRPGQTRVRVHWWELQPSTRIRRQNWFKLWREFVRVWTAMNINDFPTLIVYSQCICRRQYKAICKYLSKTFYITCMSIIWFSSTFLSTFIRFKYIVVRLLTLCLYIKCWKLMLTFLISQTDVYFLNLKCETAVRGFRMFAAIGDQVADFMWKLENSKWRQKAYKTMLHNDYFTMKFRQPKPPCLWLWAAIKMHKRLRSYTSEVNKTSEVNQEVFFVINLLWKRVISSIFSSSRCNLSL
jgi:hypothetical protein